VICKPRRAVELIAPASSSQLVHDGFNQSGRVAGRSSRILLRSRSEFDSRYAHQFSTLWAYSWKVKRETFNLRTRVQFPLRPPTFLHNLVLIGASSSNRSWSSSQWHLRQSASTLLGAFTSPTVAVRGKDEIAFRWQSSTCFAYGQFSHPFSSKWACCRLARSRTFDHRASRPDGPSIYLTCCSVCWSSTADSIALHPAQTRENLVGRKLPHPRVHSFVQTLTPSLRSCPFARFEHSTEQNRFPFLASPRNSAPQLSHVRMDTFLAPASSFEHRIEQQEETFPSCSRFLTWSSRRVKFPPHCGQTHSMPFLDRSATVWLSRFLPSQPVLQWGKLHFSKEETTNML
jgi:hypothetical protein